MDTHNFKLHNMLVRPISVSLYTPPIVWKGDCIGHLGSNDTFFFVLEGECFLNIDSQYALIMPGQLAYLPKGKKRAYTHISETFTMYEMAFHAEINGQDIMDFLQLKEENFVVDIPDTDELRRLFENSCRFELFKDPLYDIGWCANIVNIIKLYAEARQKQKSDDGYHFATVLEYMIAHLAQPITTEELAELVFMQPTYFIKRFKAAYGLPPIAYLGRLRLYKAMELLASTPLSMDHIAQEIGISDASYFARVFKKSCGVTPSEYRNAFKPSRYSKH